MLCPLSPLEIPLSDTWEAFFPKGSQNLEFKDLLKKSSPYNSIFQVFGDCLPRARRHRKTKMEEKMS